jgi:hypothetical protein
MLRCCGGGCFGLLCPQASAPSQLRLLTGLRFAAQNQSAHGMALAQFLEYNFNDLILK